MICMRSSYAQLSQNLRADLYHLSQCEKTKQKKNHKGGQNLI